MKQFCLGIFIAIALTLPAFGQGLDPLIGTWKLNLAKSLSNVPLPKSLILAFAGEGQTLTDTADLVDDQGRASKIVFRHIYDGMSHPTTGNPNYDSTIYTRIGDTINAVRFRAEKPVEVAQAVIVPGKTYTVTEEGIDVNNQPYHVVLVFDRQ
jgi:hypothetical protein